MTWSYVFFFLLFTAIPPNGKPWVFPGFSTIPLCSLCSCLHGVWQSHPPVSQDLSTSLQWVCKTHGDVWFVLARRHGMQQVSKFYGVGFCVCCVLKLPTVLICSRMYQMTLFFRLAIVFFHLLLYSHFLSFSWGNSLFPGEETNSELP